MQKWHITSLDLSQSNFKNRDEDGERIMYPDSRKLHAVAACILFLLIAVTYSALTGRPLDVLRAAFWSGAGVGIYIGLSHVFGFDPERTRVAEYAPVLMHYVDRWELRLGQATLSMLACVIVAARVLDPEHFVTAVVSGTMAAWTYFVLRLSTGGYRGKRRSGAV